MEREGGGQGGMRSPDEARTPADLVAIDNEGQSLHPSTLLQACPFCLRDEYKQLFSPPISISRAIYCYARRLPCYHRSVAHRLSLHSNLAGRVGSANRLAGSLTIVGAGGVQLVFDPELLVLAADAI